MLIMGIDPGTATTGYGVISKETNRMEVIDYGVIRTSAKLKSWLRLRRLYQEISSLIKAHQPAEIAVEQLFFNTNVTTALAVGQARGVVLLAAAEAGLVVGEYTPLQVKQAVTGYGRAAKDQIQQMVKVMLRMEAIARPDDAADALAVALCHAHTCVMTAKLRQARR